MIVSGLFAFLMLTGHAELLLTADSAASLAREKNPELVAARNVIAGAEGRARMSGRLANPDLETEVAGGQDFEGRVSVGLTQRFPLTARLRLERELSAQEVESAQLEILNRERLVAISARTAFYTLAATQESLDATRRQAELAGAFAKTLTSGVTEGFSSKLDGQQAVLAAEENRMTEESLRVEELQAGANLCSLLGLSADTRLSIPKALELPRAAPTARPVGRRPDLELAELSVSAGATDVSLAKATRWDDVGVGVFVEGERFRDEPDGIAPEALVGVRFSVPLPLWQNGSGKVAEKSAAQTRKTQQLQALRLTVQNEALTAHRVMTANHRAAALARDKTVSSARQLATDAEAAYGRAEVNIQTVFRARERLAEIERSALEARQRFFLSYSEWLGTLGEPVTQP